MKAVKIIAITLVTVALAAFICVMFFPVDTFVAKRVANVKGYDIPKEYDDIEFRYYYNRLSDDGQLAYRMAYAALLAEPDESFPKQVIIPNLGNDELKEVYSALSYDNPELFFLGNSCSMASIGSVNYLLPTYSFSRQQYNEMWAEASAAAEEILSGAPGTATSEYNKELYLHDYLVSHCEYSDSSNTNVYSMYGTLVDGSANCEGYSRTMQYLLRKLGIYNHLATGEAEGEAGNYAGHMWNIVRIDGNFYNLDTTWDDYSVTDIVDVPDNSVSHTYFNISTEDLSVNHTVDDPSLWAACVSESYGYYRNNGIYFSGYDSVVENSMKSALLLSLSNGYNSVEFAFKDKETFDIAFDRLVNDGNMYNIIVYANRFVDSSERVDTNKVQYAMDEGNCVLRFFFLR